MNPSIQLEETESKGRAYLENLAEMTYSKAGTDVLIIDHTEVDESLRGQGIGKLLLEKIVEKARQEGIKILPLCPFAKRMFQKSSELQDVLQ